MPHNQPLHLTAAAFRFFGVQGLTSPPRQVNGTVRPLWSGTLMPQPSSMEYGRVEYVDRLANAIVKGNVYGTL